jgi:glycosyltransferase involved in cell wall biosynthesis
MNILHIVPTFYPATYWGGPIYSVLGLCNSTAKISGVYLRVLTTDSAGPNPHDSLNVTAYPIKYPGGYDVFFCKRKWGWDISPTMLLRLWPMIRWADVVHLTSVYSLTTIPTLLICRILGKPVAWSPRGALQRWEGSTKPLAKWVWESVCNLLIKPGRCVLHVTSLQESIESSPRIPSAIVEIVPNGVEIPEELPARNWKLYGRLHLLYIGRLHQKKGIENLLHAIKIMESEEICLTICGTGDKAYASGLFELVRRLGLEGRVSFRGQVEGEEKTKAFMQADVCVVPSFSENFGMVVAEAMAHGVPVIVSKGTPWPEVENLDCGLWVDNNSESLVKAIFCIRDKALLEMGERGRKWMKEEFGWEAIAGRFFDVYKKLISE